MDPRKPLLESLSAVLLRQEAGLAQLIELATVEQHALVQSDFPEIERVAAAMMNACHRLEAMDAERDQLVQRIDGGSTLEDAAHLASELGSESLADQRHRLIALAGRLRALQETNAALILSAARLRERWFSMLAGMTPSTYGAAGRQEMQSGRGLVSKSA